MEKITKTELVNKILEIEPKYKKVVSKLYSKSNEELKKLYRILLKRKESK